MSATTIQLPRHMLKRWTKREYNDVVNRGVFHGQHVFLFRGDVVEMSPQGEPHAFAISKLNEELSSLFKGSAYVRIQLPFDTPGESVPEPDAAVCLYGDCQGRNWPQKALLVIEVAYSLQAEDRDKALEYAAAGVPDYWLIDILNRRTEVYRKPVPDASAVLGWRYADMSIVEESQSLRPLAKPEASIPLARILP